ncbi:DUF3263 domain-containing protein [Nocardia xishanensis]|uniref:DUF3263 domain-containing protein n=1 Tax=Nocardia xishanensis TaxID=238964 RepID=A0ABW7XA45_9NOCA
MSVYENDLLEFATEWAPYGGNDEEAYLRFGLTPGEFHRRLIHLLASPAARALGGATITKLREQCIDRLSRPAAGRA